MATGDKTALAALIVAVVGIPAAVLATRQYGNRRRKLLFDWSATPLIRRRETEDIAVTYQGEPVKDPHILTLTIANVGPADIGSSHFDGGRPLRIDLLGCYLYGSLKGTTGGPTEHEQGDSTLLTPMGLAMRGYRGQDGRVELLLTLIPRRSWWTRRRRHPPSPWSRRSRSARSGAVLGGCPLQLPDHFVGAATPLVSRLVIDRGSQLVSGQACVLLIGKWQSLRPERTEDCSRFGAHLSDLVRICGAAKLKVLS